MTDAELLELLKCDLEIITDYLDAAALASKNNELTMYLNAAKEFISTEGITLDLSKLVDCQLVVMYASWLYEKRRDNNAGMPRMLRWNLNNRLFSERGRA